MKTRTSGFEAKPLTKPSTLVLRLNQETRTPHLYIHGADRTQRHPTSRLTGHRVPDLCNYPCVTPHVSKPHDYVNHMFMRL
jgi:hypothetical protein